VRRSSRYIAVAAVLALGLAACDADDGEIEDPADLVDDDGTGDDQAAGDGDDQAAGDGAELAVADGNGVLDTVRQRGAVVCGVNDAVPGFGTVTEGGDFEGFDIDFCRAIAAAALGDADAVDWSR
jgi:general L-amino acid transport system substrate-binding protein